MAIALARAQALENVENVEKQDVINIDVMKGTPAQWHVIFILRVVYR